MVCYCIKDYNFDDSFKAGEECHYYVDEDGCVFVYKHTSKSKYADEMLESLDDFHEYFISMIFKYEHLDKTKVFETVEEINLFTGASSVYQGKFEHEPISVCLFYKIKTLYPNMSWVFTYDDGTEIEASEWVECVNELMRKL